jgi:DNA mismatch repair protein MutS2
MSAIEHFLQAVEFPKLLDQLSKDCQTLAGREFLRALRPLKETVEIEERLAKTRELEKYMTKRSDLTIPDNQSFIEPFGSAKDTGGVFSGRELAALLKFIREVVKLRQYLSQEPELPVVFQGWMARLHALPELAETLASRLSERGEIQDSASAELKQVRSRMRSLKEEVQNFYQGFLQQSETAELLQEKIVTEREGRMVVPVKRERQGQVPGFVHGMSSSGSTLFIEPKEVVENNNRLKEELLKEDEEIRKILRELTQKVLGEAKPIEETIIACAEIDAHRALARFSTRYDGTFICPGQEPRLALSGARHPLLALEAGHKFRERIVPLDLEFQPGIQVILTSGPNAGGKTVSLKTLGLTCVMAQAGLPLLARAETAIPSFAHFDSDLLDGQSLKDHLSSYAAKLKALKRMMDHTGGSCLFLLDELGAGTDPLEGGALGLACLETFRERGAFVMANTHQPLLKLLTQEEKGMANAAMLFDEATGQATFRMAVGLPGRSFAFTLARQMGFDPAILERAKSHLPAGEADLSDVLSKLGAERLAVEKARVDAQKTRDSVKKLEAELLVARRQIKDEAKRIKKEAQIEAEGLLKNTRRKMEHLIQGVEKPQGVEVNKDRIKTARQEVNQKIRNIKPAPERLVSEVRELKEGDTVFFKSGNMDVKVLSADDEKSEASILMPNGLKMSCKYTDLGKRSKAPVVPPSRPIFKAGGQALGSRDSMGKLELDLRGKMVDQALVLLDKYLDEALLVDLPFVRIIHGKGTGALKEAIHKHLPKSHPTVEFSLAEQSQGGAGVTVIKFKK